MEKYEKLFKGLEMCAGPDCNPECPYHGETRGGKTCRAWLLNDAAVALLAEESRAEGYESECEYLRERAVDLEKLKLANDAMKKDLAEWERRVKVLLGDREMANTGKARAEANAEYWRGQADALKEFMGFYFGDGAVEDGEDVELPETEAGDHV